SPRYQVSTFQPQDASSVAAITWLLTMSGLTMSFWMVVATLVGKTTKAMKLKKAAQMTALGGLRTRGDTTVATELAAAGRPLRKSNSSARAISNQTARDSLSDRKISGWNCKSRKCMLRSP